MLYLSFDGAFGAEDFTVKAPLEADANGLEASVGAGASGDVLLRVFSSGSITCEGCTTGALSVSMTSSSISSTEIDRDGTGGFAN